MSLAGNAQAQRTPDGPVDCRPTSLASDYGWPLSSGGISLVNDATYPIGPAVLSSAIAKWTGARECKADQLPPILTGPGGAGETWTVKFVRYEDFAEDESDEASLRARGVCGRVPFGTSREVYVVNEPRCKKDWQQVEILAHELGHAMRLGHPNDDAECSDRLMYGNRRLIHPHRDETEPHADDCAALEREKNRGARDRDDDGDDGGDDGDDGGDDGGGGGGGGGGGDLGDGGPGRGDGVDCAADPTHPDCREEVEVCSWECRDVPGGGVCDLQCKTYEFSTGASGGGRTTRTGVGAESYTIRLSAEATVAISLTGMTRDVDCRVGQIACTNRWGAVDDHWSRVLAAGEHTLTVWPWEGGTSDYTLTVTAGRTCSPPPRPGTWPRVE